MTDQEHLERAYGRLLAWYPRAFRRENGPEILAVLMAERQRTVSAGPAWPSPRT